MKPNLVIENPYHCIFEGNNRFLCIQPNKFIWKNSMIFTYNKFQKNSKIYLTQEAKLNTLSNLFCILSEGSEG